MTKSVEICAVWVTWRHAIVFLKSVEQKSNFSQTFEWQEMLRRKASKSYDTTAVRNDAANKTKKFVNLILENAMPKAITEVYFEFLVTNFYAQISCSHHSKFVKFTLILMNRIASAVFAYICFPASTKMLHVSQTQGKNNGPAQFRTTTANSKSKRVFWFQHQALVTIFIPTISDVFAHASYKCPVNSCFEWACERSCSVKEAGHVYLHQTE